MLGGGGGGVCMMRFGGGAARLHTLSGAAGGAAAARGAGRRWAARFRDHVRGITALCLLFVVSEGYLRRRIVA